MTQSQNLPIKPRNIQGMPLGLVEGVRYYAHVGPSPNSPDRFDVVIYPDEDAPSGAFEVSIEGFKEAAAHEFIAEFFGGADPTEGIVW